MQAKEELNECTKIAAAKKRDYENIKHTSFKTSVVSFARTYQRLNTRGTTTFTALHDAAVAMPDALLKEGANDMEKDLTGHVAQMHEAVASVNAAFPPARKPAAWLVKKPEKHGSSTTRFFQLELINNEGTEALGFVYYKEVPTHLQDGDKKGSIPITMSSKITSKVKELVITNTDRKWVLIAKSSAEASWWREYLENAVKNPESLAPTHAVISPSDAADHGNEVYSAPSTTSPAANSKPTNTVRRCVIVTHPPVCEEFKQQRQAPEL